jgi:cell wall-associated NlpC family hydrolase
MFSMRIINGLCFVVLLIVACDGPRRPTYTITAKDTGGKPIQVAAHKPIAPTDGTPDMNNINTGSTSPTELVGFARTAIGIPYKYASTDPAEGFDCSGFITYVFNHFGIAVPRTSADFTNVNSPVALEQARAGDLILFTGTDVTERTVGHMGIVVSQPGDTVTFIHSTSGKAKGVIETTLTAGYIERFVKIVRIFR